MSRTEFEDSIARTLRAQAAAEVDTARLLYGAGTRGGALVRRRRRIVVAGAGAAAALAIAGAVVAVSVVVPGGGFDSTPAAAPSTTPVAVHRVPPLPAAPDVPGAVQRPDLVGKDPAALHFTVDLPADTPSVSWRVERGIEQAELEFGTGPSVLSARVGVGSDIRTLDEADKLGQGADSPTAEPTTVGGRPATLERQEVEIERHLRAWILRWQPVDGLWARVSVMGVDIGADEVRALADALHLDRAQRCAMPFHAAELPADTTATGCLVRLGRISTRGPSTPFGALKTARLDFADPQGNLLAINAGLGGPPERTPAASRTVAGHTAYWNEWDSSVGPRGHLWIDDFDGVGIGIELRGDWSEQAAIDVAEGLRVATDLNNPESWPNN